MTEMTEAVLRTCGVRIDPVTMDQAVTTILSAARHGRPLATHLVNAYTLSLAVRDARFGELLDRGDLNLPDGRPLVWFGRRAGLRKLKSNVRGSDLTLTVCESGREQGLRHFLYGSTPQVLERFEAGLRERFPGIEIVGAESPPFRELTQEETEALVGRVSASGAQVVWVGLGTPKQDEFADEFRDRLSVPLIAVGAAFDFIAGEKPAAPKWMRQLGLEWLYRLLREPRRLWKRYLIGNAVFVWGALRNTSIEHRHKPDRPLDD